MLLYLLNPSFERFYLSFLLLDCRYQRSTTAISVGKNNLESWFFTGFKVLKIEYQHILLVCWSDELFFSEQLHLYVMPTWQQHRWHSLSSLMNCQRLPRATVELQQLVVFQSLHCLGFTRMFAVQCSSAKLMEIPGSVMMTGGLMSTFCLSHCWWRKLTYACFWLCWGWMPEISKL